MADLVASPNAPRPSGLTLEIADMLRRIEINYGREGSGPGTRFEGKLLEDVQAGAVLRRVAEFAEEAAFTLFRPGNGPAQGQSMQVVPLKALRAALLGDAE